MGIVLTALWLILFGLLAVTNFEIQFSEVILGLLAIAAGLFLLFERYGVRKA